MALSPWRIRGIGLVCVVASLTALLLYRLCDLQVSFYDTLTVFC